MCNSVNSVSDTVKCTGKHELTLTIRVTWILQAGYPASERLGTRHALDLGALQISDWRCSTFTGYDECCHTTAEGPETLTLCNMPTMTQLTSSRDEI